MPTKFTKKFRKELLKKYTGYSLAGYGHLDDGSGDYARTVPDGEGELLAKTIPDDTDTENEADREII
tara:strand:- start:342 stop:542 length:201 start_codon:yes stop_codon:yes gene_type:complete